MLRKLFFKRSVVMVWCMLYLLVLLIPIASNMLVSGQTDKLLREEINVKNRKILEVVSSGSDGILYGLDRIYTEICTNQRVNSIMRMTNEQICGERYELTKLSNEMAKFGSANKLRDIYIYFSSNDIFLTTTMSNESDAAYKARFSDFISENEWENFILPDNEDRYYVVNGESEANQKCIVYRRTYTPLNNGGGYMNLMLLIDENKLVNYTDGEIGESTFLVLDKEDNVIVRQGKDISLDGLHYKNLPDKSGIVKMKIGGQKVVVNYITSSANNWKYISVTGQKIFWNKIQNMRMLNILAMAVSLAGGALVILFAVRKQYDPIENIMRSLGAPEKRNIDVNEYRYIESRIKENLRENSEISAKLNQQNTIFRMEILTKIIKNGDIGRLNINDICKNLNISFVSESFYVVLIAIENTDNIFFEEGHSSGIDDIKTARCIVNNVSNEIFNETFYAIVLPIDGMIAALINPREHGPRTEEKIKEMCGKLVKMNSAMFNIGICCAVSCGKNGIMNVSDAYQEAKQTLDYRMLIPGSSVISFSDIPGDSMGEFYYPIETEQRLMNYIKCGDFEKSKLIIDKVFADNFSRKKLPLRVAQCLIFDIVNTIVKTIGEINKIGENSFVEELDIVDKLLNCDSVRSMHNRLIELLEKTCGYMQSVNREMTHVFREKLEKYVRENYNDTNLNISGIADKFGMNPAYMSRKYKEQSGESVLDYINEIRIGKACEMLYVQKLTVEKTAEMVGYSGSKTFKRAFVKYMGIMPGEYRKTGKRTDKQSIAAEEQNGKD